MIYLFPERRHEFVVPDYNVYMAFFDLLPMVREAHQTGDAERLRRIYGFAEWCFDQKAKDMWNAAGVGFYEHLFDSHRSQWAEMVQWLSPRVVNGCWGLWEWRLSVEELEEVKSLLAKRRETRYREARLSNRSTNQS